MKLTHLIIENNKQWSSTIVWKKGEQSFTKEASSIENTIIC
mgnify:CR=1 FL=1